MRLRGLIKAVLTAIIALTAYQAMAQDLKENKALAKQHQKIIRQFSDVAHISSDALVKDRSDNMVIFDVRKRPEYDVSHISGAIHVDPDISEQTFLAKYGDLVRGKTAVFYCSVGVRSSILADKVQAELTQQGSPAVYNLEGGLFKWHNEVRALETISTNNFVRTQTPYIHPYNRLWGRMVNDKKSTRYTPDSP